MDCKPFTFWLSETIHRIKFLDSSKWPHILKNIEKNWSDHLFLKHLEFIISFWAIKKLNRMSRFQKSKYKLYDHPIYDWGGFIRGPSFPKKIWRYWHFWRYEDKNNFKFEIFIEKSSFLGKIKMQCKKIMKNRLVEIFS